MEWIKKGGIKQVYNFYMNGIPTVKGSNFGNWTLIMPKAPKNNYFQNELRMN